MKKLSLILLSVAGCRSGRCTANTLTDDVAAMRKEMETLKTQNAELQAQIEANKKAASQTVPEDALNLGPFRLPEGLDKKDILWRVRAGLDVTQAVEAALAQKKHDEAVAAKAAEEAKAAKSK